MKITFKNSAKGLERETLLVSVSPKNKDEIAKENGLKTLYLKCDEADKMNLRKLFTLVRKMISLAKNAKAEKLAFTFDDFKFKNPEGKQASYGAGIKIEDRELGEIIGTQLDFANYEFTLYKTPPKEGFSLIKEIFILGTKKKIQNAILKGNTIADEVNKTRSLCNMPGGDMTPQILAQKAKEAVKNLPVKVVVLSEKEMRKEKMQAILSVVQGSEEESKFIIMEYWGNKNKNNNKPIVLVGKGVTFD